MVDKDTLIREANYYLENDVTIQQASVDLEVSKKTLQNHFKALQSINPNLFEKIQKKKDENINKGRSEGGKNISRVSKYTEHDALKIAKIMVEKEMTYRQAEEYFGIPKSTIFEILTSKLNSQEYGSLLSALSLANKERLSIEEFISKHSTEHVNSDIVGKTNEKKVSKR